METKKVYVSKWAVKKGIIECEVEIDHNGKPIFLEGHGVKPEQFDKLGMFDWWYTEEDALNAANLIRKKKYEKAQADVALYTEMRFGDDSIVRLDSSTTKTIEKEDEK